MRIPFPHAGGFLAATALVFVAAAASGGTRDDLAPFEELGRSYLATHCKRSTNVRDCPLEDALKHDYVHFSLGVFDLYYPDELLGDKVRAEGFRDVCAGLAGMQAKWIDWLAPTGETATQAKAELTALQAWIAGWKAGTLSSAAKDTDKDLFVTMKPDPKLVESAQRARRFLMSADDLGLVPQDKNGVRIILCPTRLEFMQTLGYAGLIDEEVRKNDWVEVAPEWTQFWLGTTLVLALEYSPWGGTDPGFKTGQPMAKIGPTVMVQHAVQQATVALLWHCQPNVPQGHFETALALNMAIEVCGEVNTIENAGSVYSSGAKTQPYEKFVPGGNPKGGVLPAQKADSLNSIVENGWRKGHGKDHFLEPLRIGQKAGAKEAKGAKKDPLANFLLKGADGGAKFVVHAPFFGPNASEQEYPPPQFLIDYAEFYRSYKIAFLYWLENFGDSASKEASEAKFRTLIRSLAKRTTEQNFDALVTSAYGEPISGKDGSTPSLEWRFLKWIQSAK